MAPASVWRKAAIAKGGKDLTPMLMAKNVVPQKIETAQKAIHASALADNFK
jgi:hypothetical protein